MHTGNSITEKFIIPPPPGSVTVLLTEEYLKSIITPPPPTFFDEYSEGKKNYSSDVDSDYHSVGDSPAAQKSRFTQENSFGSPSARDDCRVGRDSAHNRENRGEGRSNLDHIRRNKMYNSLNRPAHHGARVKRRGSSDDVLSITSHDGSRPLSPRPLSPRPLSPDSRPMSPRDEGMLLGNLGFEDLDYGPSFQAELSSEAHGAIDHFIRSEHRYISDLTSLLTIHIDPLQYLPFLNIDTVNSIRSSLQKLLHFHQSTCQALDTYFTNCVEHRENGRVDYSAMVNYLCDTLMDQRSGFKVYLTFCSARARLIRNIGLLSEEHDVSVRWDKYVEQCNPTRDPAQSLEAGLAMPLQRVSDYSKMVTEIQLRAGVARGSVLSEKLGRTAAMLDGVSKAVQERVNMQQQFSCLYRNNRKLEVLIGPIEELLYYGSVVEVKSRDIESFVPAAESETGAAGLLLLVYKKGVAVVNRCKVKKKHSFNRVAAGSQHSSQREEYTLKKFYPVSCLQLKDLPQSHVFQLTDTLASQQIILATRQVQVKMELVRNVADIICDYDRFLSSSIQMKDTV